MAPAGEALLCLAHQVFPELSAHGVFLHGAQHRSSLSDHL